MNGALSTVPELKPSFPPGWLPRELETGGFVDPLRSDLHGSFRAPIWYVQRFRLATPLLVRVRQDEGFFFAENETLRLVGTGTNPEEALVDFSMHLVYFHDYYAKIDDRKLTEEAKRLKQLFASIFVEEP